MTASSGRSPANRSVRAAHQLAEQPVGEIVEIVQPVAQERVGLPLHLRARIVLHALDRRLGGEAVADRLLQTPRPAAILGEHLVGFENLAVLAGSRLGAAREKIVDRKLQARHRRVEAAKLVLDVLGDELRDDDARLVQHDVAERDAFGEGRSLQMHRAVDVEIGARHRDVFHLAGREHLRQHHGGRLQRLELLLGVDAVGAVLHDEHAERAPGAQHRHAEEGVVDLLARLRQVGEGRMRLRVGEVQRARLSRDRADQAAADGERRPVHRARLQAFGGIELEHVVGAQHIDGAHLRDHVGRDERDHLVEPLLGADRLRHDLAELPQEHARPGERSPGCCQADLLKAGQRQGLRNPGRTGSN